MVGDNPVDESLDSLVVADVACPELVRRPVDRSSGARDDGGALRGEDGADSGADTSHTPPSPGRQRRSIAG